MIKLAERVYANKVTASNGKFWEAVMSWFENESVSKSYDQILLEASYSPYGREIYMAAMYGIASGGIGQPQ